VLIEADTSGTCMVLPLCFLSARLWPLASLPRSRPFGAELRRSWAHIVAAGHRKGSGAKQSCVFRHPDQFCFVFVSFTPPSTAHATSFSNASAASAAAASAVCARRRLADTRPARR